MQKHVFVWFPVQGTGNQGRSIAPFQKENALNSKNQAERRTSPDTGFESLAKVALCLLICLLLGTGPGWGQSSGTTSIFELPHELKKTSVSGDTIVYEIWLGLPGNEVENVSGYTLSLKFPNLTVVPEVVLVDLQGSWVGEEADGSLAYDYVQSTSSLKIQFQSTAGRVRTGVGKIATLILVTGNDSLVGQAENAQLTGVLVLVDNLGFKTLGSGLPEGGEAPFFCRIFPNPAKEWIVLESGKREDFQLKLCDMSGRELIRTTGTTGERLWIGNLTSGIYLLEIRSRHGIQKQRLMIE